MLSIKRKQDNRRAYLPTFVTSIPGVARAVSTHFELIKKDQLIEIIQLIQFIQLI